MLKQGLAPERAGDVSMTQLPPQNTLPQWARVNTLDKARYPKPFLKDKLQPLETRQMMDGEDKELDMSGMNPAQRIQYLERSLMFLRQQHSDVLRALHSEVEGLKRENKDLQHKVVMIQRSQHQQSHQSGDGSASHARSKLTGGSGFKDEGRDEVKVLFLEEEIKELKHALRESRNKNTVMTQRLEQSEEACKRQQAALTSLKHQMSQGGGAAQSSPGQDVSPALEATPDPQSVLKTDGAQPHTLAQHQALIRQLQQMNERQAHELESLKSDLRDVLYSHKWTPDAYLLAKAYISEDDKKGRSGSALPKITIKDRGQPLSDFTMVQDTASLPALTQSVSNKAVERRKRTQMMQKAKLRRQTVPE